MDEQVLPADLLNFFLELSTNYLLMVEDKNNVLYANKKTKEIPEISRVVNDISSRDFSSSKEICTTETLTADGKKTTIQWNSYRYPNNTSGSVLLYIGQDVTELKEAKQSVATLNYILTKVPGFVFWKDESLRLLGCNDNFAKQVGLKNPGQIVGLTDYDLPWTKSQTEQFLTDDRQVMRTGIPILNMEEKQRQLDGKDLFLLTSKVPLYEEEELSGVLGIYVDITKFKETELAESELKKANYQLEGAKLISGSVAHEIRTPLATIKSAIQGIDCSISKLIRANQLAAKKGLEIEVVTYQEIENIKEAIKLINKKVDQSNSIINMLLTKLQSINFEFSEFSVCSARDCIQDAISEFVLPDSIINKVDFKKENDFQFLGNCTLITHVIMNLLKNAVFYILKAKKGEISIWLEPHAKTNNIHFKDTGTGISATILPHIFDSFFTTESSIGTGIGLAFSKMAMQSHRGTISCLSEEGAYTEFILSFPKLDNQ